MDTSLRSVWQQNKSVCQGLCYFERSEKSTEFKICLKALKLHFKFMDTSLRSVWQNLWHKECLVWQNKSVWLFYEYDKKIVIASRFLKNSVAIHKFSVAFSWLATQNKALRPKKHPKILAKYRAIHACKKALHAHAQHSRNFEQMLYVKVLFFVVNFSTRD